jgi:hypothetical protein
MQEGLENSSEVEARGGSGKRTKPTTTKKNFP